VLSGINSSSGLQLFFRRSPAVGLTDPIIILNDNNSPFVYIFTSKTNKSIAPLCSVNATSHRRINIAHFIYFLSGTVFPSARNNNVCYVGSIRLFSQLIYFHLVFFLTKILGGDY